MPAYDYRCTKCDHRFEVSRPMGSNSEDKCPECGAPAKRVFTPVGVAFKGNGFHNTDYRPRSAEKTESAPASCPAKKDGSTSCSGCPAATE
jgi:putative FmdB family regulatory protein